MASGLLLDAYDTSWGDKVIRVNEREFDFGTSKTNEAFRKATRMRYKNGAFQYGRGVYNDYDDVVASFQQKYSPHLQKEFAKGPSVTTLEFVTKDGRVPLSAAEVQRAVEEAAAKSNKTINNLNDFLGIARELFDESIVNRSIYESDHRKLFFDGVKHVSTSSTLFLNQLANNQEALREAAGDIREIVSNPEARETLVRNILHHGAFGRVLKGSGLDEARALSTEFHTALANMDFEHPFFKRFASKKNPNALENEIYQGFVNTGMFGAGVTDAAKLTAEQKQTVKQYWGDFLTQFRHSLDTMLSDVTEGGMLFGDSITDQIKQEDAQMLVSRTVQAIHEHIAQSSQHVGQSLNELEEKIFVREGDYRAIRELYKPESFDVVLANPPYRPVGEGQANKLSGVARARHEFTATLQDVVAAARYGLRFGGHFGMVHLPERLGEIIVALHEKQMEVKRLQMVQPKAGKAPNMMLIEAVVGASPGGLKVLPPLIVHQDDGSYTDEILQIYGIKPSP